MEPRRRISGGGWSVVGRLRKAVKKINFILFSIGIIRRWELISSIHQRRRRRRQQQQQRRFLSFNERLVGLQGYTELTEDHDHDHHRSSVNNGGGVLDRTCSLDQDDIDKRSERFIANFRRDLLLQRQVSLELGYCKLN
ncbi:unnamed protein product [Linum tenue]|uniref:Uncharacterized protein n=1 Tax=Linum tenue TaxID=586396 RepID=A0AAV0GUV7_9ROSI|nr:unnamed protein product [Linum tenue]